MTRRPVPPPCRRCGGPTWVISRRCFNDCQPKRTAATKEPK